MLSDRGRKENRQISPPCGVRSAGGERAKAIILIWDNMDNENLTEEESRRIAYMIEHLDEYPEFPVKSLNDEDNKGYVTEIIV